MKYKISLIFPFILLLASCSVTKNIPSHVRKAPQLSEATQKKFDYYYFEGLRLKEESKFDQALATFNMCYQIDSLDAGLSSELGLLYEALGMNNEAEKCLSRSVQFDPSNWWYNMQLISFDLNQRKMKEAIHVAESLKVNFPDKPQTYQILSTLYKQTKQYAKAIDAFNKLESLNGIDESIAIEKFNLYRQLKKPKKAIKEIDKLVQKFPSESKYKVVRGDIYMQQGKTKQAFKVYSKVLKTDPDDPYVYVSLSDYYNSIGQPEKATEQIVKALKLDQLDVDQKIDILGQYVQKLIKDTVKLDETESLFKMLVDRYPLEEKVHGYYAMFLQYRKRYPEAIAELESMLNINPKNEKTWFQLIQIYMTERDYKDIVKVTTRAIHDLPNRPQWYFYKSLSLFQLKEYEEALKTNYEAIPHLTNKNNILKSDIYAQIGDIYYQMKQSDKAFAAYDTSLIANPSNYLVMNNYAYYLSEENTNLKKAESMSAKAVEQQPKNSTFLDTYAWIFYKEGNMTLAKFYIERAIDNLDPKEGEGVIMEHYGDILWKSGDKTKAIEMWQKSYDAGNQNEILKEKIDKKEFIEPEGTSK